MFDLDDTLYDEKTFVTSGFRAVAEYFLPNDSETMFEKMTAVLENEGRGKETILCDCLEALLGYIYLDLGAETVENVIKNYIYNKVETIQK